MDDYIVLHAGRGLHTADPFEAGAAAGRARTLDGEPATPHVEVAELSANDVRDLSRDPEVAAIARPIPLTLIKPMDNGIGTAATDAWGIAAVNADTSPFDGTGVSVAVLDTGIDAQHPAFQGVALVQKDFTGEGDGDGQGHGTHCAGTILGRDVDGTRIGVARGVTRVLIGKVLDASGAGSSEALFDAMTWATENGAHVVSMSLGFDFPGMVERLSQQMPVKLATSRALEAYRANLRMFDALMDMIRQGAAFRRDAIVVAASGNESQLNGNPPIAIAVSVPAAADGVVAVGAAGESPEGLVIADFSNTFPQVCAPGVNVLSAKAGGGLRALNGTSMATPHVAGVAALWRQSLEGTGVPVSAQNVIARLIASTTRSGFAPGTADAHRGNGLVQAPQA
ncbi:MAG: S8 family serine peptidase [Luteitalea sp.]|nr:S8 family serine peptidase [Luteitalea sp.]